MSTLGAKLANSTEIKNLAAIPLFGNRCSESLLHEIPLQCNLKLSVSLVDLCVSLLRLCAASLALCHSCSLCMDDTGPSGSTQSLLPLRGSLWLCVYLSLLLRWSLGTMPASLPRTHCPSLQLIIDSISLSKPRSRE